MSRIKLGVLLALVAIVMFAVTAARVTTAQGQGKGHDKAPDNDDDINSSRVQQGFAISPVPLNFAGKNRALVGLGSYIVNAQSGCSGCHTQPPYHPGGNPFLGQPESINSEHYLAGGQRIGPVFSRNLTPEVPSGLPAGLTYEQFLDVMRNGTDYDHAHPQFGPGLIIMPWPEFGKMTDRDLKAVYEYLRAIPHAEPGH